MNEIAIPLIVGLASGTLGAIVGARVAIAVLQSQVADIRAEIVELRRARHDQTSAILRLDGRVTSLEDRVDE